ncbi:hypothetical protein SDC9_75010 [bioreactor metagenome]|uniref:DUF2229 domain-containing protein n=1 Tax=bioreactor metagenome TaxID=1076179 RepID=A0A644YQW2_9ZZZZ
MVVTFPNMGNVSLAAAALFQGLQIPYVMPLPNSRQTLEAGAFHAPEEICLPFKLVLGNVLECVRRGADTIIITGSCGPCRFGEYCELLMKILNRLELGHVEFVVLDLSHEITLEEFRARIGRLSKASPLSSVAQIRALQKAIKVASLCDALDARACELAGYERISGTCRRLVASVKAAVLHAGSPEESLRLLKAGMDKLERVELDPFRNPLKVALIGEIFTIIDPFSNLNLEDKLMDYGVSSRRLLSPSWWVKDMLLRPLRMNSREIHRAAEDYLPYNVGGHGKECVGEAVLAKEQGMDGAIQIFPMGCMPEVVAKAILPSIQRDLDFPIMTLVVDEVTGEAGYVTRVEAFLDMLRSRRRSASPPAAAAHRLPGSAGEV